MMAEQNSLSVAVVIASSGRPRILHETVVSLAAQHVQPSEVVLSVPSVRDVLEETARLPRVDVTTGVRGLPAQRNQGVRALHTAPELVAFFDDDVVLASDYLERMVECFAANADVVLADGFTVANGVRAGEYGRAQADAILDQRVNTSRIGWEMRTTAYGCNMIARASAIVEFDEGLPLYGWLEDLDFARRMMGHGRVIRCWDARMVHLGVSSGRVSGRRYGFSQIMNSYHLLKKGSITRTEMMVKYWLRPVGANLAKSIWNPRSEIDRRGRLAGNAKALMLVLRRQDVPERILEMP